MNSGQMDRGNENPTQHFLMIEETHEKTAVRLVGTGIWTRDLPNESLVRYHGATSLGRFYLFIFTFIYQSAFNKIDLKSREKRQLLVYADDINLLEEIYNQGNNGIFSKVNQWHWFKGIIRK